MEDTFLVHMRESSEEAAKVYLAIIDRHLSEVFPEIGMFEVWEDRNDLVGTTYGCDEGSYCFAIAQVFEEVEFVEDAGWRGCDVDLLDCYDLGTAAALNWEAVLTWGYPANALETLSLVDVPSVVVFVVHKIFRFVDSGEGSWVGLV